MINGYQSDTTSGSISNEEHVLFIPNEHVHSIFSLVQESNSYAIINENLVMTKDIRLRASTLGFISAYAISLPVPLHIEQTIFPIFSDKGNRFEAYIDSEGRLFVTGTFTEVGEQLYATIYPYVAKQPLTYFVDG